jgi:hypothetical protein
MRSINLKRVYDFLQLLAMGGGATQRIIIIFYSYFIYYDLFTKKVEIMNRN